MSTPTAKPMPDTAPDALSNTAPDTLPGGNVTPPGAGGEDDGMRALLALLDVVDALPGAAELRARGYDLLDAAAGAAIVDVGCGGGRAVAELRERGARAIGVDPNGQMIAAARSRWPDGDFRAGTAQVLPFADGELTGYRADKVFHELADPATALAEARRVLVPGGRIVLLGQDWDGFLIDSDDPALTRTIVHARADAVPNPRVARRYRNLLWEHGFADVTVQAELGVFTDSALLPLLAGIAAAAHSAGAITGAQAESWAAEQGDRATAGRLFLAIPLFLAAATRP